MPTCGNILKIYTSVCIYCVSPCFVTVSVVGGLAKSVQDSLEDIALEMVEEFDNERQTLQNELKDVRDIKVAALTNYSCYQFSLVYIWYVHLYVCMACVT